MPKPPMTRTNPGDWHGSSWRTLTRSGVLQNRHPRLPGGVRTRRGGGFVERDGGGRVLAAGGAQGWWRRRRSHREPVTIGGG